MRPPMTIADRQILARRAEEYLLDRGGWVPVADICRRFGVTERMLRADAARPRGQRDGLLDHCALATEHGLLHVAHSTAADRIRAKRRLRRHWLAEIRRDRALRAAIGRAHTGQLLLLPS